MDSFPGVRWGDSHLVDWPVAHYLLSWPTLLCVVCGWSELLQKGSQVEIQMPSLL